MQANGCARCKPIIRSKSIIIGKLNSDIEDQKTRILQLEKDCLYWKNLYENANGRGEFDFSDVHSQYCEPAQLIIPAFGNYLENLISVHPILSSVLNLFTSGSHARKYVANSTHTQWIHWSDWYRSFLCDMFLRSRAPKSIFRTNMMLSVYFLLTNLSEPCWRVLERLRILVARQTVEAWVKNQTKQLKFENSVLILSFDNCDFKKHVTHVRSDHRTTMLHVITQFVIEIGVEVDIPAVDVWFDVDRIEFGEWLQSNAVEARTFAETCFTSMVNRDETLALRYMYSNRDSNLIRSDFVILEPELNCSTLKYEDIERVLCKFYSNYLETSSRTFAFVSGDQQTWIKMWYLRILHPVKYLWLIPIPGEWHWTWHILKGIYRMYGKTLLLPLSIVLNYTSLDLEADTFHYAEDFLQIVTLALFKWCMKCISNTNFNSPLDWLHFIQQNKPAYKLAYALIYYFIPYWITRSIIKHNISSEFDNMWRYWIHLFIAAGKKHYSILSIRFLWIRRSLNPNIVTLFDSN